MYMIGNHTVNLKLIKYIQYKWFDWVSLFDGISIFCGLFNAKDILVEGQLQYYLKHSQRE